MNISEKATERVRHELKFRICKTVSSTYLTPKMIRVQVTSPDLAGFASFGYDDHVKLFFAAQGSEIAMPEIGPNGLQYPKHLPPPDARDYTPRHFDADTNTLTLDFVVHGDGPAITWARNTKPGDTIGVGGPRASFVVKKSFDWYLLIGDETALPAIGRRIEELPAGTKIIAFAEIANAEERQTFEARPDIDIYWLERNEKIAGDNALILDALRCLSLPEGEGYVFVAGEAEMSKSVRAYLVDECGHNPDWIKAAGYWHFGEADFYDGHAH